MALQRYRLKVFDGQYEGLHNNLYEIDVDLESPTRNSILDRQLSALIELGRNANEPMDRPLRKVCAVSTGNPILDGVA